LDLYEIREDPVRNLDKIESILLELRELGIEYPPIAEYPDYRASARRASIRLQAFTMLSDCLRRFLSEEDLREIDQTRELRDYAAEFDSKLHTFIDKSEEEYELLRLTITRENRRYFEDLLQKLIGVRLEYELIPNLFEKMDFEKKSTAFNIDGKVIEVDGRYERESHRGARAERLVGKEVVIVECTTTIDVGEIKKFESKRKIIEAKYAEDKHNWNYDILDFKAWIVACYGWNNELIEEAKARDIIPITPFELEKKLKQNKIFDRRFPICPTSEKTSDN